ncbi:hypothetical protein [Amycolatopsis sp. WAC 04182]|uniref:hypothetical protein n=1 Tax=Amycolatopsis sp. WAC 04182 TaxID=2203198 RepID=UPI0018F33A40
MNRCARTPRGVARLIRSAGRQSICSADPSARDAKKSGAWERHRRALAVVASGQDSHIAPGKVEVEWSPIGGAAGGLKVVVEEALGGEADFAFLDERTVLFELVGVGVVGWWFGEFVGHAEVGAQDVDDGLPLVLVVLGEAFERVKAAEPDGGLVGAELLDGLGVQLGDPARGGIGAGGVGDPLLVRLGGGGDILLVGEGAFAVVEIGFGGVLAPPRRGKGRPLPRCRHRCSTRSSTHRSGLSRGRGR